VIESTDAEMAYSAWVKSYLDEIGPLDDDERTSLVHGNIRAFAAWAKRHPAPSSGDLVSTRLCGAAMAMCQNEADHPGDHWHPRYRATPADSLDAPGCEQLARLAGVSRTDALRAAIDADPIRRARVDAIKDEMVRHTHHPEDPCDCEPPADSLDVERLTVALRGMAFDPDATRFARKIAAEYVRLRVMDATERKALWARRRREGVDRRDFR